MSGNSKMSSALPRGDANGLGVITRDLIDKPHRFHVMIAIIDCAKVISNNDTGEIIPTSRIRRAEVVLPADLGAAQQLMCHAIERRTGRTDLPPDVEGDINLAFGRIDPRTGEHIDRDSES